MPIKNWGRALNQFAIEFGKERVPFGYIFHLHRISDTPTELKVRLQGDLKGIKL